MKVYGLLYRLNELVSYNFDYDSRIRIRRLAIRFRSSQQKRGVLTMKLNCIWSGGFCSGVLGSVDYHFIAISPRPTLI